MSDGGEPEIFPSVRRDEVDPADWSYPPRPPAVADAVRRPKERFVADLFADAPDPLPERIGPDYYRDRAEPTRLQRGEECTGFGLAAIADYHLRKGFSVAEWRSLPAAERRELTASRRMMYEMAQLLDDEDYVTGSTLRGALRAWKRIGVCSEPSWPYHPDDEDGRVHGRLTLRRVLDAYARPGGPYYRIDVTDIASLKDALARHLPLFVVARTHVGWYRLYMEGTDAVIRRRPDDAVKGGHAFVVVGYDERGFWIHNSWGEHWGDGGYGLLTYDDWRSHAISAWCVIPRPSPRPAAAPDRSIEPSRVAATRSDMWRHVIAIGDDGRVAQAGPYAMDDADIKTQLYLFQEATRSWDGRRLAVFADGGYWAPESTAERLRPFRDQLMGEGIYPIFLLWETPWLDATVAWLRGELAPEGAPDTIDDMRAAWAARGGRVVVNSMFAESIAPRVWHELRRRAGLACGASGAVRRLVESIEYKWHQCRRNGRPFDLHLIAHGPGDLLLGSIARALPVPVATCNLWAPTTSVAEFWSGYASMLGEGRLDHVSVITLDGDAEHAEAFGPMPESLLSMVAAVLAVRNLKLDDAVEVPGEAEAGQGPTWRPAPEPILGMERFVRADTRLAALCRDGRLELHSVPSASHTELAGSADVRDRTVRSITTHPTRRETPGSNGSLDPAPVDGATPPAPRDPLRRAIDTLRDLDAGRPG